MSENEQLEAFLGADEPASTPPPAPPPEPAPKSEQAAVKPDAKPSVESKPDAAKPAPAKADEDDEDAELEARDGEVLVPRRAYEDERRKRQDWKQRAAAAEAARDELRAQIEAAQRRSAEPPPQQAPAPMPMPPIDPAQDPQGYANYLHGMVLNERFNNSEMLLRRELGNDKVDAAIAEFQVLAAQNPNLSAEIRQQIDPFRWAYDRVKSQVEKREFLRELGDDPVAWQQAKLQEMRAQIEAELAGQQPQQQRSAVPAMAPSLANARSAAPRSAPAETGGPADLAELFPAYHERKRAR